MCHPPPSTQDRLPHHSDGRFTCFKAILYPLKVACLAQRFAAQTDSEVVLSVGAFRICKQLSAMGNPPIWTPHNCALLGQLWRRTGSLNVVVRLCQVLTFVYVCNRREAGMVLGWCLALNKKPLGS